MRRRRPGHGDDRGARLIQLHVEEHGEGFPLLLIQGLGWSKWGSQEQWADYARTAPGACLRQPRHRLVCKAAGAVHDRATGRRRGVRARRARDERPRTSTATRWVASSRLRSRCGARARALARARRHRAWRARPRALPPETLEIWVAVVRAAARGGGPRRASRRPSRRAGPRSTMASTRHWWPRASIPPRRASAGGPVHREPAYMEQGVRWSRSACPRSWSTASSTASCPVGTAGCWRSACLAPSSSACRGQAHVPMLEEPAAFSALVCGFLDRL